MASHFHQGSSWTRALLTAFPGEVGTGLAPLPALPVPVAWSGKRDSASATFGDLPGSFQNVSSVSCEGLTRTHLNLQVLRPQRGPETKLCD